MTTPRPLRAWQSEAISGYFAVPGRRDYLVTATPGAGKTTFALTLARTLLDRKVVRRVIVVCPTDHLRTQWTDAANEFGITLDPTLSNSVGPLSTDFDGYACTYAQVAAKPLLHRRRTEVLPTLVILDEIHHAGDGLTWGDAIRQAFDPAKHRLSLTGTPFRTSQGETIPFVRYEQDSDGSKHSVGDYTYGYKEALADHVVRPVMFAAYSGVSRWRNSAGEVIAASLSDPLNKEEEMTAWRTALNPGGQWIPHVIAAADQRLTEVRAAGMPDAGAMILASDQEDARAYADIIFKITGVKPVVVLSDDPKSSEYIEAFAVSTERWAVSVRMISEGVDIKRLAVGVFATTYRTPLFFAQAIGRFVRASHKREIATIFLPAVRPLLTLAAEMETQRDHVIAAAKAEDDTALDEMPPDRPEPVEPLLGFEALEAQASFAHVLFGGRAVTGEETLVVSDDEQEFLGFPGLLDPSQMAVLLKQREAETRRTVSVKTEGEPGPAAVQQAHKQAADLRREVNSLVGRVAARTQAPHATVHAKVRKNVPGPASSSATLAQLTARRDYLLTLTR